LVFNLVNPGLGAGFVAVGARRSGHADAADRLLAGLDRQVIRSI
jgi:hypothetical protein